MLYRHLGLVRAFGVESGHHMGFVIHPGNAKSFVEGGLANFEFGVFQPLAALQRVVPGLVAALSGIHAGGRLGAVRGPTDRRRPSRLDPLATRGQRDLFHGRVASNLKSGISNLKSLIPNP